MLLASLPSPPRSGGEGRRIRFERIIFFNHLSLIGGMLAIVAFGAGCFSLDAAMGRKS
jgi:uncharacterized membrane protein YphA (DoxX/SURF4 family)